MSPIFSDPISVLELCALFFTIGYLIKLTVVGDTYEASASSFPQVAQTSFNRSSVIQTKFFSQPEMPCYAVCNLNNRSLLKFSVSAIEERLRSFFSVGNLISLPKKSLRGQHLSR